MHSRRAGQLFSELDLVLTETGQGAIRIRLAVLMMVLFLCGAAFPLSAETVGAARKAGYPSLEQNFKRAKERAETGHKEDWLYFATLLDGRRKSSHVDPDEATRWYRRAAEAGSGEAAYYLGKRYEDGHTVGQDDRQAFEWYMRGAEARSRAAMREVGKYYFYGKAVPQDYAQASFWFQRMRQRGFKEPEEAALAAAALTPHEMAKVQERLAAARTKERLQGKISRMKKRLSHPYAVGLGWPIFLWLVLFIASLREAAFKPVCGVPLPVWLAGSFGFGGMTGMGILAASYATFFLIFFGVALLFFCGLVFSGLLWLSCLLLLISFFWKPEIRDKLRFAGASSGCFFNRRRIGGACLVEGCYLAF